MNPSELESARKLVEAATPPPWVERPAVHDDELREDIISKANGNMNVASDMAENDSAFIAAARTLVPALLDEVENLKARIDRLVAAGNGLYYMHGDPCENESKMCALTAAWSAAKTPDPGKEGA